MRKIIITLLGVASGGVVSAATTSTSFTIDGNLSDTCLISTQAANVNLGDLGVSGGASGTTSFSVTCRRDAQYDIVVSSQNDWELQNSTSVLGYVLSYTGANSRVANVWSGNSGGYVVATGIVSDGVADVYPLSVDANSAGSGLMSGTYSDTVNININYS